MFWFHYGICFETDCHRRLRTDFLKNALIPIRQIYSSTYFYGLRLLIFRVSSKILLIWVLSRWTNGREDGETAVRHFIDVRNCKKNHCRTKFLTFSSNVCLMILIVMIHNICKPHISTEKGSTTRKSQYVLSFFLLPYFSCLLLDQHDFSKCFFFFSFENGEDKVSVSLLHYSSCVLTITWFI